MTATHDGYHVEPPAKGGSSALGLALHQARRIARHRVPRCDARQ
ncbi:MAG: hypothetical protein ACK4UL_09305 [Novosphingobium meiothermophilum]|nr:MULTISPECIES: hypothetical protein [Novosphingobium]